MFEQNLVPNVSTHRSYRETGPAIWVRPESQRITIGEEQLPGVKSPIEGGPLVFNLAEYKSKIHNKDLPAYERAMAGWGSEFAPLHQIKLKEEIKANHTYNEGQIEWFKAGSALNMIGKVDN